MSITETAVKSFRSVVPALQRASSQLPTFTLDQIMTEQNDWQDLFGPPVEQLKPSEQIPQSLQEILSARGVQYVTSDLIKFVQEGNRLPWLTVVEDLGGRAARMEVLDRPVRIPYSIVSEEGEPDYPVRREFNIGQQSAFGSYKDFSGEMNIVWSKPYGTLKEWHQAGYTRCKVNAQVQTAQGREATELEVEATEDRSEFTLTIVKQNAETGDLTYQYASTYDRDGNIKNP